MFQLTAQDRKVLVKLAHTSPSILKKLLIGMTASFDDESDVALDNHDKIWKMVKPVLRGAGMRDDQIVSWIDDTWNDKWNMTPLSSRDLRELMNMAGMEA